VNALSKLLILTVFVSTISTHSQSMEDQESNLETIDILYKQEKRINELKHQLFQIIREQHEYNKPSKFKNFIAKHFCDKALYSLSLSPIKYLQEDIFKNLESNTKLISKILINHNGRNVIPFPGITSTLLFNLATFKILPPTLSSVITAQTSKYLFDRFVNEKRLLLTNLSIFNSIKTKNKVGDLSQTFSSKLQDYINYLENFLEKNPETIYKICDDFKTLKIAIKEQKATEQIELKIEGGILTVNTLVQGSDSLNLKVPKKVLSFTRNNNIRLIIIDIFQKLIIETALKDLQKQYQYNKEKLKQKIRVFKNIFTKIPKIEIKDLPHEQKICPICWQDLEPESHIFILDCNHVYGKECLNELLVRPNHPNACPICRRNIASNPKEFVLT